MHLPGQHHGCLLPLPPAVGCYQQGNASGVRLQPQSVHGAAQQAVSMEACSCRIHCSQSTQAPAQQVSPSLLNPTKLQMRL
jgi:hypothetical protein